MVLAMLKVQTIYLFTFAGFFSSNYALSFFLHDFKRDFGLALATLPKFDTYKSAKYFYALIHMHLNRKIFVNRINMAYGVFN